MILPVYVFGHPILRKKAAEADESQDYSTLIADMFETMYHSQGVGLAGPQIGQSLAIFVIDTEPFKEAYDDVEIYKGAFINPVITNESGADFTFNEGCLSLPDIHEDVTRKSEIDIEYTDETGKRRKEHFKGYVARVIQHEYDHLQGIVFTDHLSQLKKMVLKRKFNDIANGKLKPNYKTKNK